MREILFRGQRVDYNNPANNGKWYEGVYFPKDDTTPAIIYSGKRHNHGVFVDPETVGQYTGLTDKNGKKIFEGDILQYKNETCWVINWCAEETRFVVTGYIDGKKCEHICIDTVFRDFEVIGNIHDNPELLKGENK